MALTLLLEHPSSLSGIVWMEANPMVAGHIPVAFYLYVMQRRIQLKDADICLHNIPFVSQFLRRNI
jgi:hypothetical protein